MDEAIAFFWLKGEGRSLFIFTVSGVCRIKAEPLSDKLFSHFEHD